MVNYKITFSKEDKLKFNRNASREAAIEFGLNHNTHRVFKNKKAYDRKRDKKVIF